MIWPYDMSELGNMIGLKKGAETSGWNKWAYNFNFER